MSYSGEELWRSSPEQHVDVALCLLECAHQIIGAIEILMGAFPAKQGAGRCRILQLDALIWLICFRGRDRRALEGARQGFGVVQGLVRVGPGQGLRREDVGGGCRAQGGHLLDLQRQVGETAVVR